MSLDGDVDEVVLSETKIRETVQSLGQQITRTYSRESDLLLIGVLRGCVVFLSDLIREIQIPLEIDFLAVESYGSSSKSSGVVRVLKDLDENIQGRNLLLVEDILDTGLTLDYLTGYLRARNPMSLKMCSLLDKPARRKVEVQLDFGGVEVPNEFLVGYGLDYSQKYRNLPYIASLKDDVIDEC